MMNAPILEMAENFQHHLEEAIGCAQNSPCEVERCGVVIVDPSKRIIIAHGRTHPPHPFTCRAYCTPPCKEKIICAERDALEHLRAFRPWVHEKNFVLIHARIDARGVFIPSLLPSCRSCAAWLLKEKVEGIWIFHVNGWEFYTPLEYNAIAYISQGGNPKVTHLCRHAL